MRDSTIFILALLKALLCRGLIAAVDHLAAVRSIVMGMYAEIHQQLQIAEILATKNTKYTKRLPKAIPENSVSSVLSVAKLLQLAHSS